MGDPLAGRRVPETHERTIADRVQPSPFGTVRVAGDSYGVAFEVAERDLLAARHIPDPHGALVVARDQPAPIGAKGIAGDVFGFGVPNQGAGLPGRDVPDLHGP